MDRQVQETLPIALHELALVAADRGDFEGADTLLVEAAMMAAGLLPDADRNRSRIAYSRGLLKMAQNHSHLAASQLESVITELGGPAVPGLGNALAAGARAWALAQEGTHRHDEAIEHLKAARGLLPDEPAADQVDRCLAELIERLG